MMTQTAIFPGGESGQPPLVFDGVGIEPQHYRGEPWLLADQIGSALRIEAPEAALREILDRNWFEFPESLATRIPVETPEGPRQALAVSPLGAYVIGTLASSPVAPRFRRWLLDHLAAFLGWLAREVEAQGGAIRQLTARIEALDGERRESADAVSRLAARLERAERLARRRDDGAADIDYDGPIPVFGGLIGGRDCPVVDVRDLHRYLGVNLYVTSWTRGRIAEYGFVEDRDYAVSYRRGREHKEGGRPATDYHLSIDMAVALARFERRPKTDSAIRWLSECRDKAVARRPGGCGLADAPVAGLDGTRPSVTGGLGRAIAFAFGGNEVRGAWIDGEPWWVASDVLVGLEYAESYKPSRAMAHLPERWRGVHRIHTPSGEQKTLLISEQGLYFFLGRSDKPKALPFQMYYAGEVLPAIRKTGRYEGEGDGMATEAALPAPVPSLAEHIPGPGPSGTEAGPVGIPCGVLTFHFEGGPVRVMWRRGEWRFVAKDVSAALGYVKWRGFTGPFASVPSTERGQSMVDTPVGPRDLGTITEAGVDAFLGRSKKSAAAAFQAWLADTVKPALRPSLAGRGE